MPVSTTGAVFGVKEAIKELRSIDPQLRKAFNRDAKAIAAPIIADAKANYPAKYLSGMARVWRRGNRELFPYVRSEATSGVKFKVDTKRRNTSVLLIVQSSAAAAIAEFAGRGPGKGSRPGPARDRFVANLTAKAGPAPRALWPAAEANETRVTAEMLDLVEGLMETLNRNLVRG